MKPSLNTCSNACYEEDGRPGGFQLVGYALLILFLSNNKTTSGHTGLDWRCPGVWNLYIKIIKQTEIYLFIFGIIMYIFKVKGLNMTYWQH